MPSSTKPHLSQKHREEIVAMAHEGMTAEQIRQHFLQSYNLDFTVSTYANYIRKSRKERQAIAQEIITRDIERTAKTDMQIMDAVISSLFNMFSQAVLNEDSNQATKISSALNQWHERRLSLTGIDKDEDTTTQVLQELNQKFGSIN